MIVSTLGLQEPWRSQLAAAADGRPVRHCELAGLAPEELQQVEVLFTYGYDLPPERLERMPALKWVHIGQSGMDKLPMAQLAEKGVWLTNSRGINAVAIAEYAMGMMLNVVRKSFVFYEAARAGRWDLETHLDEVCGKTLGILGLGRVGRELAVRAAAFGMQVLGLDLAAGPVPGVGQVYAPARRLELLARCDFAVVCMPLTPDTFHLIGSEELAAMKPTAWLMNVGRGPIVNEAALVEALRKKAIAGAVLDVFEAEPLPAASPLWQMENVYITPHIAGDHQASYMPRMMGVLCGNLAAYPHFEEMENPVNTARGF